MTECARDPACASSAWFAVVIVAFFVLLVSHTIGASDAPFTAAAAIEHAGTCAA